MALSTLFSVWAIALALALLSIAVIVRPFSTILADVCGSENRARFWTAYACLLTVIAPLMAVSTPDLLDTTWGSLDGRTLQRAVFLALGGIVLALLCVGRAIWKSIAGMPRTPDAPAAPDQTGAQP